mmetsp:Transcript_14830/g.16048  ORF Transcript_14830/g.16048 Transcript_14830/m.16048 type:complete len:164 (+) Transcript_14830:164-655(+)
MSQTYTLGRVRFAEEDYQLLIGSSLVILAILIISYFALFVEPSPEAEATYVRSDEPKSLETTNSVSSPKREVTPKKEVVDEREEEQPFTRNTSSNSKSPVRSYNNSQEEEEPEEEEEHSVVTPARRGRGRKKQDKTSEDFGTLLSPEGRRTSLRLKKRRDDSQ